MTTTTTDPSMPAAPADDAATLQSMIAAWALAVGNRDIDGVLAAHAPDLLVFDVVPPARARGLDAYRRAWSDGFFPWMGDDGTFALREVEVACGDRVAFATASIDCAGTEHGRRVAFRLRLTLGFEKRGDAWWFVHEHHSETVTPAHA